MKRFSISVLMILLTVSLRDLYAQTPEEQYVRIYNTIQQADELRSQGQGRQAFDRYRAAQDGLVKLQKVYPDWNSRIIDFRLKYVAEKMTPLQSTVPVESVTAPRTLPIAPTPTVVPSPKQPIQTAPTPTPAPAPTPTPAPGSPGDLESQLKTASTSIKQLLSDKALLEAKLREALSAQPAAVDPRELSKAQDQLRKLSKENDVLKVTVDQEKQKTATAITPAQFEETKKALSEAQRKIQQQTETVTALNAEKVLLQSRIKAMGDDSQTAKNLKRENDDLRKKTQDANARAKGREENKAMMTELERRLRQVQSDLAAQKARNEILASEKAVVDKRLKQISSEKSRSPESVAAAQEREIAELRAAVSKHLERVARLESDLKAAFEERVSFEKQRASWERDRQTWQQERADLEKQTTTLKQEKGELEKQLASANRNAAATPVAPVASARSDDKKLAAQEKKVKQLEKEREDLNKRLQTAEAELKDRKLKAGQQDKLTKEVASLKAKVEAYEAKKVPYTKDELALFRQPQRLALAKPAPLKKTNVKAAPAPVEQPVADTATPQPNPAPPKPVSREWPAGAGPLLAQAQSAFAARRFEVAENAYAQVLKLDDRNISALANLAVIQLEENKFTEADSTLQKALKEDPGDGQSLSLLGILRFRQSQFDEALDVLSRAVKVDPNNAETQNFLGITLSQKGQRDAAEAALRKAVQLQPDYASAHQNLAVVYATQKPPFLELARWHYQKAQAGGQPSNPDLEKLLEAAK